MNIVNLTPHDIVLCGKTITASGTIARCSETSHQIDEIDGIPVNVKEYGQITGLPAAQAGTIYIVSAIVAQALNGSREDCFVGDKAVRNSAGQIIGIEALAFIPRK